VFKYLTCRMADNANTAVLNKILEFLTRVFGLLKDKEYKMHEAEASVLVPFLVEKTSGHNNAKFRTATRALFGTMCHCYAPSKVFNFLLDGVEKAKNLKARAECLDECTAMIQKVGLGVCPYKKIVPNVAKVCVVLHSSITCTACDTDQLSCGVVSCGGGGGGGAGRGRRRQRHP
jgi:hypothetical protein